MLGAHTWPDLWPLRLERVVSTSKMLGTCLGLSLVPGIMQIFLPSLSFSICRMGLGRVRIPKG